MKTQHNFTVALATVFGMGLAVSAGVLAQGGYGYGPGYGHMMGGYGYGMHEPGMMYGSQGMPMMGGCYGLGAFAGLDLTQEQRAEFNKLQDTLRKHQWELQGKLQDQYAKLRELQGAETPDKAAIDSAYDEIFKLRRQFVQATTDAQTNVEKLLTANQRKAVTTLRRGGPGPCVASQSQP